MTSNAMTTDQVTNPYDVATGINQVWNDEIELDRFYRQFTEAGGDSPVWRQAERIARDERVATLPNYPPDLIDQDTGDIWEWEHFPAGGGDPGCARDDAVPATMITTGPGPAPSWSVSTGSTAWARSGATRPRTRTSDLRAGR